MKTTEDQLKEMAKAAERNQKLLAKVLGEKPISKSNPFVQYAKATKN